MSYPHTSKTREKIKKRKLILSGYARVLLFIHFCKKRMFNVPDLSNYGSSLNKKADIFLKTFVVAKVVVK